MANFDPRDYGDEPMQEVDTGKPEKPKKKKRGCLIGCGLLIFAFFCFFLVFWAVGSSGNKETEWLDTLESYRKEAQDLYTKRDDPATADKAQELADKCQNDYDAIREETGKSQLDDPLLRGYVCAKTMATDVKHMARGDNVQESESEYFEAGSELYDIITELKD